MCAKLLWTPENMKVTGKSVRTSVGVGFLALALFAAIVFLPDAHESQSPVLYVLLFGALFVGDAKSAYHHQSRVPL